jgi:hypothetical protein
MSAIGGAIVHAILDSGSEDQNTSKPLPTLSGFGVDVEPLPTDSKEVLSLKTKLRLVTARLNRSLNADNDKYLTMLEERNLALSTELENVRSQRRNTMSVVRDILEEGIADDNTEMASKDAARRLDALCIIK